MTTCSKKDLKFYFQLTATYIALILSPVSFVQSGSTDLAELLGHGLAIRIFLDVLAGIARAPHQAPLEPSGSTDLAELLGRALVEAGVIWAWSFFRDAMPKDHANLVGGLVEIAMIHGAGTTLALRTKAEEFRRLAAAEADVGDYNFAKTGYTTLEVLMRFLVGAVDGVLAGMLKRPWW